MLLGLGEEHLERIRLEQLQLGQDLEHPILVGQFDAAAVLDKGKDLLLVLPMSKGVFARQQCGADGSKGSNAFNHSWARMGRRKGPACVRPHLFVLARCIAAAQDATLAGAGGVVGIGEEAEAVAQVAQPPFGDAASTLRRE